MYQLSYFEVLVMVKSLYYDTAYFASLVLQTRTEKAKLNKHLNSCLNIGILHFNNYSPNKYTIKGTTVLMKGYMPMPHNVVFSYIS
jgi:hypothetical protein